MKLTTKQLKELIKKEIQESLNVEPPNESVEDPDITIIKDFLRTIVYKVDADELRKAWDAVIRLKNR